MEGSLTDRPRIRLRTVVVDCPDARELSDFYAALLGWPKTAETPDWVLMRDPSGGTGLSFQSEELYVPPTWPEVPGAPQKGLHLDFLVEHLDAACAHAERCGATRAPEQFLLPGVVVFLDPAGHPFCLFEDPAFQWT